MRWVESGGGPLVVVPQAHLDKWRGVDRRPTDDASDYDRACEVDRDVAVIRFADVEVLVLGDEPFRTTWLPDEQAGLFVRWIYADKEESVLQVLIDARLEEALDDSGVSFTTPGMCVLFDAAEPGDDIRGDSMVVVFEPGTYAVKSGIICPSTEARLLIHQLVRVS